MFRRLLQLYFNKRGISQEAASEALGVSQQSVSKLLKLDGNVRGSTMKKVFEAYPDFKIEYEDYLNKSEVDSGTNAIKVDFKKMTVMHVPLINKFAYAGFLQGFGDDEYIDELPTIPFANDFEAKGNYLCFEVKGDSMDDGSYESYLEGDILLCREVAQHHWRNKLHINKWDFVIVHKEHGILVKRITEHNTTTGVLTLHSLNNYYEDLDVHIKNVAKIYNVVDFRRKKNRR